MSGNTDYQQMVLDLENVIKSLEDERKELLVMRVKLSHGLELTPAEHILLCEQVRMQTDLIEEVYLKEMR